MGIYIPGLDASEKCNGCCMNLAGHCLVNKGLYVGRVNLEYNSKPDWCPTMNIQPHGRLIDADEMERFMSDGVQGDIRDYPYGDETWGEAFRWMDNRPTIIQADDCKEANDG